MKSVNAKDLKIEPVKFISRDLFEICQTVFISNYKFKHNIRRVSYEAWKNTYDLAIVRSGNQLVAFVAVIDFDRMFRHIGATEEQLRSETHPLWHIDRPQELNRRQIELCWVHPKFRHKGLATRLYRYAIDHMRATHIHIEEDRVFDRIEYWQNLGFQSCSVYKVAARENDLPSLRLLLTPHLNMINVFPLTQYDLYLAFENRDLQMKLAA